MPYKFKFLIDDESHFECELESLRCTALKNNGQRCGKQCVIGVQICWVHLLYQFNLRVKSTNSVPQQNAKGLFALNPKKDKNAILFNRGDNIIQYTGEYINKNELYRRYGKYTAPYTIEYKKDHFIDGACKRGIGTLVNHKAKTYANAEFLFTKNAETKKIDGVKLVATKIIRNSEEIFVNYGKGYKFNEKNIVNETKKCR